MDEATRERLEFPQLLALLARHTSFSPGEEAALALKPATNPRAVRQRQEATTAMRRYLDDGGRLSLAGAQDIRPALAHARRDGVLTGPQLVGVADTAEVFTRVKQALTDAEQPVLQNLLAGLQPLPRLVAACRQALDSDGYVQDQASEKLAQLRSRQRGLQARIRQRLDRFLQRAGRAGYLQERHVTQRSGRYVLPVKAEYRGQVEGVVHGQSTSGATVFIEPAAVVELNNRLRETISAAERETYRILTDLSRLVAAEAQGLADGLAALARVDVVLARAHFAQELQGVPPELTDELIVDLQSARHPLLEPGAVPIDVTLGLDFDLLVITGPNTGGKTVSLKTIGLLVLMAQSGMHIPAAPGSRLGIFQQVFADIGDEQSIQQSLSTFSAHMSNIVSFVRRCDARSLLLLDEIGAGTDPDEGSALAMALLRHFRQAAALTVATTHHSRLKAFALQEPRAANASVAFDPETLAPTYHLVVGLPGRSHALDIAQRLGMPADILQAAQEWLGQDAGQLEAAIAGAEAAHRKLAAQEEDLRAQRQEVAALRRQWEEKLADLGQRRQRWLQQTRADVTTQLNQIITEAENILADLRQASRDGQAGEAVGEHTRRQLARLRHQVDEALHREGRDGRPSQKKQAAARPLEATVDVSAEVEGPWPPEVGANVWVTRLRQVGQLVSYADGGKTALVQLGPLATRVAVKELAPPPADSLPPEQVLPVSASVGTQLARDKAAAIDDEIHLRGLTVAEATERLDKYIDDAVLAGLDRVRVVHGKGTGTLRREVARFLTADRRVASWALAPARQGGTGVTIVTLET